MRDPKRRAKSMAILWMKKCYDLGITAGEIVAESAVTTSAVTTVTTKEKEKGKEETSPHTPLKEKRKKEEKAPPPPPARACERAVNGNPTFEAVERYAVINGIAADFAKRLFDKLNRENEFLRWRHPKSGQPMRNWQSYFSICWKRREDFDPPEPAPAPQVPQIDFKALEDL